MKKRATLTLWIALLALFALAAFLANTGLVFPPPGDYQPDSRYERAQVKKIITDTLAPDPDFPELLIGVQEVEMVLLSGAQKGRPVLAKNFVGRLENKPVQVGTKIIAFSTDGFRTAMISGYSRETTLAALALLFVLTVAVFGGAKGVKALLALIFTLVSVVVLFIPLLLRGANPVVAATVVVIFSTAVTMLALNGLSPKTGAAVAGCIICTFCAGGVALLFGRLAHVSTYTTPEAENLIFIAQQTNLRLHDILFAGVIIASSGAVMDTCISVASAMHELAVLNPGLTPGALLQAGLNVGRDIMGTMTNTLILAFTGSALNTLLIVFMYRMPYFRTVNLDLFVVEVLRGLSGSIGLALAVPVTALLAARLLRPRAGEKSV
ncbi:MAG: YibE/F family protein [Gracilibacteraceae bacterium]|jgi:uncharacterized membrane protein|nr:YibE/F family protein [Gracilibacteraceae bacterium]